MVAAFTQLHQNIQQAHLVRLSSTIDNINVLHKDFGIPVKHAHLRSTALLDAWHYQLQTNYTEEKGHCHHMLYHYV
jgi:hypothetical protein